MTKVYVHFTTNFVGGHLDGLVHSGHVSYPEGCSSINKDLDFRMKHNSKECTVTSPGNSKIYYSNVYVSPTK
jgi:hypothetical protein